MTAMRCTDAARSIRAVVAVNCAVKGRGMSPQGARTCRVLIGPAGFAGGQTPR